MQLDGSRTDGDGNGRNGNGAGDVQAAWTRVKRRLRAELGEDVFASWFARLELEDVVNGVARLTVPTRFLKSWIESHYVDRVLNTFKSEVEDVVRLDVGVRGASAPPRPVAGLAKTAAPAGPLARYQAAGAPAPAQGAVANAVSETVAAARSDSASSGDMSSAPLDARLTFASFVVGRSNALAHAAGERVSRHDGEGALYNPLYVHAGVGLGKTHLLHGIGHAARDAGHRVIYLTADRFMYGFVNALKTQNALAFKERLRAIDLLILDDVQFIQGKSIQAEFGHTLNALIDAGKQVVVASDRPPTELEALDERVRSRLAGGLVVEIGTLDEGLRASILQARLTAVRVTHPTFEVAPAVAAYVAKAITANGRDLEGAVNRLLAHATLTGAPVTVETAEAAIRDLVKNREPKRIKIEDIQKLVASRYNVSRSDILSERRTAAVVKPRQIAMYLSKVLTLRSLPEIGRRFGGRDHTTVLHAVRKIEKLIGDDPVLGDEVELLKRMLQD
ncbi:chromosomal replication initiator protein DnaA [Methylobacterium haplocladii]|uniref:Chromosomal replication initiator protein DnaA n=1 Tax=Methylobacterium haplocladii TaxID=1176176 RepID=A0A512ILZ4_9HYPH|nr:chromosomal replication initiator protein DnaA [Methylobacterium haplocladii]GEO98736.1 chromosomal replication initiator protein DnaA [Methylobacterium haplocladii]GJD85822.1 Chromosomal replication initiator protein DnaA [Methylobacterium haplocladii]GLS59271.1 chromosomal replication initiator protein DnaA [Methylobacterium haplocladii]